MYYIHAVPLNINILIVSTSLDALMIGNLMFCILLLRQDPLPDPDWCGQGVDAGHLLQEREDGALPQHPGLYSIRWLLELSTNLREVFTVPREGPYQDLLLVAMCKCLLALSHLRIYHLCHYDKRRLNTIRRPEIGTLLHKYHDWWAALMIFANHPLGAGPRWCAAAPWTWRGSPWTSRPATSTWQAVSRCCCCC